MIKSAVRILLFFIIVFVAYPAPEITDADWQCMNTCGINGTNSSVFATAFGKGQIYIGGQFSIAGNIYANKIARWDGEKWNALGKGCDGSVNALVYDNQGILYAAGNFDTAGGIAADHIAKWDGESWSALGEGFDGAIQALACDSSGKLYAAVYFDTARAAQRLSCRDGGTWTAVAGKINGYINAIACGKGGDVYVGGTFDTIGGIPARHIAKWDGNTWSALGSGISGRIYSIAVAADGTVAVGGGLLDSAGTIKVRTVAEWDGVSWSKFGFNGESTDITDVTALVFDKSGNLFIGGNATAGVASGFHFMAEFTKNSWNNFGLQYYFTGDINSLVCDDSGRVYIGGSYDEMIYSATLVPAENISFWNGKKYCSLETHSIKGSVYDIACDRVGNVFIGGAFDSIGGIAANSIVRWNNGIWSPLDSGIDMVVSSIIIDKNNNLVCAGKFTRAGGSTVSNIANWNGSEWNGFSGGMNAEVLAIGCDHKGNIIAGGYFDTAGGVIARHIARWDGVKWNPLGAGLGSHINPTWGYPNSFAFDSNDKLYAGGAFDSAGAIAAFDFACWDGSLWSTPIKGPDKEINATAISNKDDIFVGCEDGLKRWNGNGWTTMGTASVNAIVFDNDGNMYVGGKYGVSRFDGSSWSNLGSGTDGPVTCMAVHDSILYIGGSFVVAGGNISPQIARVNIHASADRVISGLKKSDHHVGPSVYCVDEVLRIKCNGGKYTQVEVFSIAGRRIFSRAIASGKESVDIRLPGLGRSMYLCRVKSENGDFTKCFIK